jgi:cytidylate kinase
VNKKPVIAIDGPSGAGKSTLGKLLAKKYNLSYIDTGAMYRALALRAFDVGLDINDDGELKKFCSMVNMIYEEKNGSLRIVVDGYDYTEKIRSQNAGKLSSLISTKEPIRKYLVNFQRKLGEKGGVVMEGRDIGTVVFPDADIKFYLDASRETRGGRRFSELKEKGVKVNRERVMESEKERDERDISRDLSPLCQAEDAVYIDSTHCSIDEVLGKMIEIANKTFRGNGAH